MRCPTLMMGTPHPKGASARKTDARRGNQMSEIEKRDQPKKDIVRDAPPQANYWGAMSEEVTEAAPRYRGPGKLAGQVRKAYEDPTSANP